MQTYFDEIELLLFVRQKDNWDEKSIWWQEIIYLIFFAIPGIFTIWNPNAKNKSKIHWEKSHSNVPKVFTEHCGIFVQSSANDQKRFGKDQKKFSNAQGRSWAMIRKIPEVWLEGCRDELWPTSTLLLQCIFAFLCFTLFIQYFNASLHFLVFPLLYSFLQWTLAFICFTLLLYFTLLYFVLLHFALRFFTYFVLLYFIYYSNASLLYLVLLYYFTLLCFTFYFSLQCIVALLYSYI